MATRREFIRDCSALAASATLVPLSVTTVSRRWREVSLEDISLAAFAAQLSTRFVLRDAKGNGQALELFEAEPSGQGTEGFSGEAGGENFSLIFRGDATRPLRQGTYSFEHARIGRFEMFIVPIGCQDRSHCYYEAVFNRLPPESLPRGLFGVRRHTR